MRRNHRILSTILVMLAFGMILPIGARTFAQTDTAIAPSLVISQFKITSSNGQYITLYNQTATAIDLSRYQLEYFNNYDLAKASSSKLIGLTGVIPPHGYAMVNDGNMLLCYQLTLNSVSLGLSSTAGFLELIAYDQSLSNGQLGQVVQDYVGWSKTPATGAQTLPTSTAGALQRLPLDGQFNPTVLSAGAGSWRAIQPDANNPCTFTTFSVGATPAQAAPTGMSSLLPSVQPDAVNVTGGAAAESSQVAAGIPAGDIGLMAPTITEVLPNPLGTGTDADEEFIELYNSNDTAFELTGFKLQSGLTSFHSYTFPAGITLVPHGYTAFYTSSTGLSLSNTKGQVALFDPLENQLNQTDEYGTANDGYAWAQGSGKWQWSTSPTPGEVNKIAAPSPKASARKKSTTKTASKPPSTKQSIGTSKAKTPAVAATAPFVEASSKTPIHPAVLALVGCLALLYAGYEYRKDLGNFIFRLRTHLGARGRNWRAPSRRGSD